jgi:serine/threonine protein kinase
MGRTGDSFLDNERSCLEHLDLDCFPKIRGFGSKGDLQYLAMNLFGHSVSMICTTYGSQLSRHVSLPICFEMLKVIEKLHSLGFVHCDIKPGNFLISSNPNSPLVLIDFGVARRHIDSSTGKPLPAPEAGGFVGTRKYASLFAHQSEPPSRRDDLISWFYSTVELLTAGLPWSDAKTAEDLVEMKAAFDVRSLQLPELAEIFDYLSGLTYESSPDYRFVRAKFRAILDREQVKLKQFQWGQFYLDHSNLEPAATEKKAKRNLSGDKSCSVQ